MKTKIEWEQTIAEIIETINEKFPELTKYLPEIPSSSSRQDKVGVEIGNLEEYYNSLKNILLTYSQTHDPATNEALIEKLTFPGYTVYTESDDIYSKGQKLEDMDPEDPNKLKSLNEKEGSANEKDFEENMSGDDLDVPGSELDDQKEQLGSEDEENNYYSLGGDNHHDLDEVDS